MNEYGKLENGKFIPAPNPLFTDGNMVFNPSTEEYERNGYVPVVRTPHPENGKFYEAVWETVGGEIVRVWVEAEIPILTQESM